MEGSSPSILISFPVISMGCPGVMYLLRVCVWMSSRAWMYMLEPDARMMFPLVDWSSRWNSLEGSTQSSKWCTSGFHLSPGLNFPIILRESWKKP